MKRRQRWLRVIVIVGHGVLCLFTLSMGNEPLAALLGLLAVLWLAATWWEYTHGRWGVKPAD